MKKIILFLIVLNLIYSCNTGKYVSDYKQIKKTIDTLVILSPLVVIDAANYTNNKRESDLEKRVEKILSSKADSILARKYNIEKDFSVNNYNEENIKELSNLLGNLKTSKNPINKLKLSDGIIKKTTINNEKYFLFIYLKGHYTIGVSSYETLGQGNTLNLTPARTANEEVGVLLLNRNNEVLYFNYIFSSNDPRLKELVERDFMKVIKSIYYK